MKQNLRIGRDDGFLRRYDYGDRVVLAVDLPVEDESVDVDVVDETAIVVVERDGRIAESEFEVPAGDARVDVNNGVLTVAIERSDSGGVTGGTEDDIGTGDDLTDVDEDA